MQTFTKHEVLAYAAELLREWGDGEKPPKLRYGICESLACVALGRRGYSLVRELSPFWHLYSGNKEYPVKGRDRSPVDEFWYYRGLWAANEYGDNRRDLCLFLADEIEDYPETGEC